MPSKLTDISCNTDIDTRIGAALVLGKCVCENILFAYALLGYDTTLRVFGIGKGVALKQLRSSEDLNVQAKVFNRRFVIVKEIAYVGERASVSLYSES